MGTKTKNKKLAGSILLFVLLCVAVAIKGRTGGESKFPEGEATPTPAVPSALYNVWIEETLGDGIRILHDGGSKVYPLASVPDSSLEGCIADVTLTEGVVTGITVKQDMIEAKVLRIGDDFVELEGYGVLPREKESRVYRMYGETEEVTWQDVLVGYTSSSFVLSGEKIGAALIQQPVEVTSIRVLIQTSSYGGYYHETLEIGSETGFYFSDGIGRTEWLDGGEKVEITPELVEEYGGRMYLGTAEDAGKISLYNVKRAVGVPSYRGTLEVTAEGGRLLVVNELPLEEYLYGVLPSEMPESFGKEALKAQAVCARSYACNQLLANRYHAYGAHVDDSMNCQVYQNYGETAASVEAVKETFGKVLSRNGECITAYYFSCSYGHTSDSYDIWGESAGTLFEGVVQTEEKDTGNLKEEKDFVKFLDSEQEWYDEESVWFRWNTVVGSELDERILERLKERQKAVPDMILVKEAESGDTMKFVQGEVTEFGTLNDIIIAERGDSGVITKLILVGSKSVWLIQKEYNIRYILAPLNAVYLKDGSTTGNVTLLPSAYFTVEKGENHFVIRGGGHGHGSGMSQYGAKHLASAGWEFEEILMHYYRDTEISYLYR